ncbi:MAG: response regulator transcription factor [Devosia sp.]|uniref:LuxR C-terminal-related transcriptional regulator n=1 Tax=Devosia sp. 66-22 TaxID=1895753 RepID=UPI000A56D68B|nr:LuxR C-terminal-related transcriptional regulator [Devosia sp. 66-22]MBN9347279.1 response regulator transcription factor [Devosia sp.]
MSLNQTVRGLIDRLPTLTTEERWVVQAVLDMADQRSRLLGATEPRAEAPAPAERRSRNEPAYYASLSAAPYYVTTRELEVLDLLLSGLSNKEVAGKLGISFKTVQAHRQRIMDKLGARSPMHLAEIVRSVGVL